MADPLARLRAIPKAGPPNDDLSAVRGNCTDEVKQISLNALSYYSGGGTNVFAADQAKHMKLTDVNVRRRQSSPENTSLPQALEAEMIVELEVHEDMLNREGRTLSGAAVVHFFDICTMGVLFVLGATVKQDPGGASLSMEVKYHAPALHGTVIKIVTTTMAINGRIVHARGEIFDKKSGRLLFSGVHTIMPIANHREVAKKAASKL